MIAYYMTACMTACRYVFSQVFFNINPETLNFSLLYYEGNHYCEVGTDGDQAGVFMKGATTHCPNGSQLAMVDIYFELIKPFKLDINFA